MSDVPVNNQPTDATADAVEPRTLSGLRWLLCIYLTGALVRVVLNQTVRGMTVYSDEWLYVEAGRTVMSGNGTWMGLFYTALPNYLYPLILAPILNHFSWERAFDLIRAVNALVMGLTIFPVYGLARELLDRRQSLWAAGLTALLPSMGFCVRTMAEVVFFPLAMLALWLGYRAILVPSIVRCLGAGLAIGMTFHAKPHGLMLPVMFALTVLAFEAIGLVRDREHALSHRLLRFARRVGMHAVTALGWALALAPRLPLAAMEFWPEPYSLQGFMGFYYKMQTEARSFSWPVFALTLVLNLGGWIVAVGFMPAWLLAVGWGDWVRGRLRDRRRILLVLMTTVTLLVLLLVIGRHRARGLGINLVYERYYFFVLPLALVGFLVFIPDFVWRARNAGRMFVNRINVALFALMYGSLVTYWSAWNTPSNAPSLVGGLMLMRWNNTPGPWNWVYLAGMGGSLVLFLAAGRSASRTLWAVAVLLFSFNVAWYAVHGGVIYGINRPHVEVARAVSRELGREDRLLVLRDELDLQLANQVGYANRGASVYFHPANAFWHVAPLTPKSDGRIDSLYPDHPTWLFASTDWVFDRPPVKHFDAGALYQLDDESPLTINRAQLDAYMAGDGRELPIKRLGSADEVELELIEKEWPATWIAGTVHRVRLHVRNARAFLPPYPGESLAVGYDWKDPDRTGHWHAVVRDDGRHGLLPRGMKSGEDCVVEIDVLAPDSPYEAWVLTFAPLLIKEGGRKFAIADSFLEIVRVEGGGE